MVLVTPCRLTCPVSRVWETPQAVPFYSGFCDCKQQEPVHVNLRKYYIENMWFIDLGENSKRQKVGQLMRSRYYDIFYLDC